jgi:hypothetical protein
VGDGRVNTGRGKLVLAQRGAWLCEAH